MPQEPTDLKALRERFPFRFKEPQIDPSAFVASGAKVFGDVQIGKESSIWFNSVLRGDVNSIRVGDRTNIQDLSMVHVSYEYSETEIGSDVTIGHNAVIHGCKIGNNSLIGMGAIILDKAEIGDHVIIGAGSIVTVGKKIPSGTKAFGSPAKVVGELTQEELDYIAFSSQHYVNLSKTYR